MVSSMHHHASYANITAIRPDSDKIMMVFLYKALADKRTILPSCYKCKTINAYCKPVGCLRRLFRDPMISVGIDFCFQLHKQPCLSYFLLIKTVKCNI